MTSRPPMYRAAAALRGLCVATALAALVAHPAPGAADALDYDPDALEWSGLSYLSRTALEANVVLRLRDHVDWRAVDRDDVLLLLYPLSVTGARDVVAFLEDGGRAIVADDFGGAVPLLEAVGLARVAPPSDHDRRYGGHPAFPEFALGDAGEHFLFFHADRIVANHPSALAVRDPARCAPIVSWRGADAPALVAECRVGDGRLLAVADASLFINEMLRGVHGDKQFVANVLRYYCGPADCAVDLVLPRATWAGRYRPGPPPVTDVGSFFRASVATLDALVTDANEALRELPLDPWLGLAACLVVLGLLVRRHIGPRRAPFEGFRAPALPVVSAVEVRARTPVGRRRADYSEPLGLLARRLAERAARLPDGPERRALEQLLDRVGRLPPAPRVEGRRLRTVSASEFLGFYRQSRRVAGDAAGAQARPPGPLREEAR